MVDVGMGEDDGVDLIDRAGKPDVLLARLAPMALKQPTVEEDGLTTDTENVTGTGDLTSSAGEFDLHDVALAGVLAKASIKPWESE